MYQLDLNLMFLYNLIKDLLRNTDFNGLATNYFNILLILYFYYNCNILK